MTVHDSKEPDHLTHLRQRLREFASARDWGQFHSPKNLVMALTGEVGELTEHFQWLTEEQSNALAEDKLDAVRDEIADVQIYLMLLADRLDISLLQAVDDKIRKNERKYPVERARGSSRKYTES